MFLITEWTKHVADEGIDKTVAPKPKDLNYKFRLLDDDGRIYAYGYSDAENDEDAFEPLDYYGSLYGVTEIQYINPESGEYETLDTMYWVKDNF
jgi:transposase